MLRLRAEPGRSVRRHQPLCHPRASRHHHAQGHAASPAPSWRVLKVFASSSEKLYVITFVCCAYTKKMLCHAWEEERKMPCIYHLRGHHAGFLWIACSECPLPCKYQELRVSHSYWGAFSPPAVGPTPDLENIATI